jgi:hypothetical protein
MADDGIPGNSLFDALAGAATGKSSNRAGLQGYVASQQTLNGLRSAQTDDAIGKALAAQQKAKAQQGLEGAIAAQTGDAALAHTVATAAQAGLGNMDELAKGNLGLQQYGNRATLGDANQLGQPSQTAAQQGISGKVAEPVALPDAYSTLPGAPAPNVGTSPLGDAKISNLDATAGLHNAQAAVGGFNPHAAGGGLNLPDSETGAISQAVNEGRLDLSKVNSRNAHIIATSLMNNPGININGLSADAGLQRNPTFQQRAMTLDALPSVISNVRDAGKKLDFSNAKVVGDMQGWVNGQVNDPDMTNYMTQRNDALMSIAGVMRGVGMSDKAHQAEVEAMHPTLSQGALDGWFNAQMTALQPRLAQAHRVTQLGGPRSATAVTPQAPATGAPGAAPQPGAPQGAAPMSLDDYLKAHGH